MFSASYLEDQGNFKKFSEILRSFANFTKHSNFWEIQETPLTPQSQNCLSFEN